MGLLDNFSENVGGLSGGLLSAGRMFSAMSQSLASAPPGQSGAAAWGGALGIGSKTLDASFAHERNQRDEEQFKSYAEAQATLAKPGSDDAVFWKTVASGNKAAQRMFGPLITARAARERTATKALPSADDQRLNRKIRHARGVMKLLNGAAPGETASIMNRFGVDSLSSIITDARTVLKGVPDPTYEQDAGEAIFGPVYQMMRKHIAERRAAGEESGASAAEAEDEGGFFTDLANAAGDIARSAGNLIGIGGDSATPDAATGSSAVPGSFESDLDSALGVPSVATPTDTPAIQTPSGSPPQANFAPAREAPPGTGSGINVRGRAGDISEQAKVSANLFAVEGLKRRGLLADDFTIPAPTQVTPARGPVVPDHESALTRGLVNFGDLISGRAGAKSLARERVSRGLYGQ